MCKYPNVRMCKYPNMRISEYANVRISEYANLLLTSQTSSPKKDFKSMDRYEYLCVTMPTYVVGLRTVNMFNNILFY